MHAIKIRSLHALQLWQQRLPLCLHFPVEIRLEMQSAGARGKGAGGEGMPGAVERCALVRAGQSARLIGLHNACLQQLLPPQRNVEERVPTAQGPRATCV